MKNPELMMYRAAIGQILADAGINRETIKAMLKQSIDERIDKQVPGQIENRMANFVNTFAFRDALRDAIREETKRAVADVDISVTMPLKYCTDNELVRECTKRGLTVSLTKPTNG